MKAENKTTKMKTKKAEKLPKDKLKVCGGAGKTQEKSIPYHPNYCSRVDHCSAVW